MKTALTIAGSDPVGGAGLQADLKVFQSFGIHGLSLPSALTAQNTTGVDSIYPVEEDFFIRQLDVLLDDIRPDAVKTGMLYSKRLVKEVFEKITEYSLPNLVVDPVTMSSSGKSLAEDKALDTLRETLLPLAKIITPNIYEAWLLTGIRIENVADMKKAAQALKEMGPESVVITGGHLDGIAVDLFLDNRTLQRMESPKIKGEYHGTGCAFSAALAALLAKGCSPLEAAKKAKDFINKAIKYAYHIGKGMGILKVTPHNS